MATEMKEHPTVSGPAEAQNINPGAHRRIDPSTQAGLPPSAFLRRMSFSFDASSSLGINLVDSSIAPCMCSYRITVSGMAGGSFTFVDPTIFDWVVPNGRASLDNEAVNDAENRASQGFTLTRGTDSSRARFWMTFEWGGGDIFNAKNVQSMCETEQIFLTGRAEELYAGVSSSDPDVAAFSSFFMEVPYFQFIHILVIFLVLGIGADDVFVMYDGWRFSKDSKEIKEMEQLGEEEDAILEKRMEIAFTNTIGAIFTTSFTTIVSFLATSISPIMPISTFGILAATAIFLNFLLVISLIPAILLTNHILFVKRQCCMYDIYEMLVTERDQDVEFLGDGKGKEEGKGRGVGGQKEEEEEGKREEEEECHSREKKKGGVNDDITTAAVVGGGEEGNGAHYDDDDDDDTKRRPQNSSCSSNSKKRPPDGEGGGGVIVGPRTRTSDATIATRLSVGRSIASIDSKAALVAAGGGGDSGSGTNVVVGKEGGDRKIKHNNANDEQHGEQPPHGGMERKASESEEHHPEDWLDKFIASAYIPLMTVKRGRYYLVAMAIVAALFAYGWVSFAFSLFLEPPDESAQFLPDDNMLVIVPEQISEDFLAGEFSQFAEVRYPFGIDRFDRGDFNVYEPGQDRGEVRFSGQFDLYPAAAQQTFNFACDTARGFSCSDSACSFSTLMFPSPGAIKCFLPSFQSWFLSRNNMTTTQATRETFLSELMAYRGADTEADDGLSRPDKLALIGFVGGELRYVRIDFYTSIKTDESTVDKAEARETADDFADAVNAYARSVGADRFSMGDTFSASPVWVGVEAELGIVAGFYQGLIICFPVAFAVMLASTQNLVLSLVAIGTIFFIVVSVLATIVWQGNQLGIAEAIAGVIVIGFSVDYVIHLGHSFMDAYHGYGLPDRASRFNHAAVGMGGTVIAGGITSFGAALPLLGTQHLFFPTMGALMAATVAFSLTFSLLFFMGFLLVAGPEGGVGEVVWFLRCCFSEECLRKSRIVTAEDEEDMYKMQDAKRERELLLMQKQGSGMGGGGRGRGGKECTV
eukprot:jgi/Bigna1/133432/aug1.21_g8140